MASIYFVRIIVVSCILLFLAAIVFICDLPSKKSNILTFTFAQDKPCYEPVTYDRTRYCVKILSVSDDDSTVTEVTVPTEIYNTLTNRLVANQTGDIVLFRIMQNSACESAIKEIRGKVWGTHVVLGKY